MNALLLHAVDFPARTRGTTLKHMNAFARYGNLEVLPHNVADCVTAELRSLPFDAVIIDASVLCLRWARPATAMHRVRADYRWICELPAVRIAMPQDDYDHAHVLDDWLADWNVDIVYSVLPEHTAAVYPRCSTQAEIKFALCGYIDDDDIDEFRRLSRPIEERQIDVGYRVRDVPAKFGHFGRIKSRLCGAFAQAALGSPLAVDLAAGESGTLFGDDWRAFLGNSRHTLGAEGGSSVLDRRGEVQDRIDAARRAEPSLDEDQLVEKCITATDEALTFAMPSPRLFEIAMAGSCPLLLSGSYLGLVTPGEHYIEITPGFANIEQVVETLSDRARAARIATAFQERLLGDPKLRYSSFVSGICADIEAHRVSGTATGLPLATVIGHFASVRVGIVERLQSEVTPYVVEVERLAGAAEEGRQLLAQAHDEARRVYGERDAAYEEIRRLAEAVEQRGVEGAAFAADLEFALSVLREFSRSLPELVSIAAIHAAVSAARPGEGRFEKILGVLSALGARTGGYAPWPEVAAALRAAGSDRADRDAVLAIAASVPCGPGVMGGRKGFPDTLTMRGKLSALRARLQGRRPLDIALAAYRRLRSSQGDGGDAGSAVESRGDDVTSRKSK